ncbi:MAG: SDR family NAD(P)-dependent oxidoreductase [Bacteroidetes bacterium]|nr:SDR family NAD(P)-dependent oxidoreductase [Bacteroidota bacterium]
MKLLQIGTGPGIGLAVARKFGKAGFEILMVARNAEKLEGFKSELAAEGIVAQGFAADIADEAAFGAVLQEIVAQHADIEVLHYNASAYNPATPTNMSIPVMISDFKTSVVGAVIAVQAVFPQMEARKQGHILLTGGGTALKAPAMLASLGIGKAGLRNLAFSLAEECAPAGVHVATITISGMVKPGTHFDPELIAGEFWRLYQQVPDDWETEVVW